MTSTIGKVETVTLVEGGTSTNSTGTNTNVQLTAQQEGGIFTTGAGGAAAGAQGGNKTIIAIIIIAVAAVAFWLVFKKMK